jgi:competence protein ComEC
MRRILLFGLISGAFLLILSAYHLVKFSDNKFHLIFCDVGQGDGILLRTPKGSDIIIDGGPQENSMTNCLEKHLPFWDRTIEAVFMTHPDADHLTGLIGVLKSYNVHFFGTSKAPKDTAVYQELLSLLKSNGIPVQYVYKGDKLKTKDGVVLTTYWPTKEFINLKSTETNDYSLVQLVTYGKFRALLTGDIPSTYLNSVMPLIGQLDVFKPPHHGSKTGIDEFTFQHLVPKLAVLSFGYHNRYHHPAPEVLDLLKKYDIPVRNTLKGDVEIVSDGKSWSIKD